MALILLNRVQETATANTTVSFSLAGAVFGFEPFSGIGNGNTTYYSATDSAGHWEIGLGTYSSSGNLLIRTTPYQHTGFSLGAETAFTGTVNVFISYLANNGAVYLDPSFNVSALGSITSATWNASTIGVAYGGTGVTTSSGANSVVLRDADQNIAVNRLNQNSTTTTAAGGTTTLTAASTFSQILTGTGGQTFKLPDATTLTNTTTFEFNNNATGTLTITDNAGATVGTISSGGAAAIALLSNGTVGGTWDVHAYIPENVTWGTNSLALGSTVITGGTWNGGTIQSGYGGTGLTTFAGANNALYSTSSSALAAGTLPVAAGGTGLTSYTANGVVYASGTGTLATGSALTFNGTNLINSGAYTAPSNGSGAGTKTLIQGSTGTGAAGASGGNGYIELIGGGGTSLWTSFVVGTLARRRGGINLQAGTAQADAGGTYVHGSNINITGSNGTNNGTSVGVGTAITLTSGSTTKVDTFTSTGATVSVSGASSSSSGSVSLNAGNFTYSAGLSNAGGSINVNSSSSTQGGQVAFTAGAYNTATAYNNGASIDVNPGTTTNGGNIRLRPGIAGVPATTTGKAYVTDPATGTDYEILTPGNITTVALTGFGVNCVPYINASNVLTTTYALTFDGSTLATTGNITLANNKAFQIQNASAVTQQVLTLGSDNNVYFGQVTSPSAASVYYYGLNQIFNIGSSEKMRISGATGGVGAVGIGYSSLTSVGDNGLAVLGNVGIGTNAPTAKLDVVSSSSGATTEVLRLSNNGTGGGTQAQLTFYAAATNYAQITGGYSTAPNLTSNVASGGYHAWQLAAANQMYLDATGLGIGTSSPSAKLSIQQTGISGTTTIISAVAEAAVSSPTVFDFDHYQNGDGVGSSFLRFRKANGTIASPTVVTANRATGRVGSQMYDGAAFYDNALILFSADGTPALNSTPGRIQFYTTAASSTSVTERVRIDATGTFRVKGAGTAGSTDAVQFDGAAPASSLLLNSTGNVGIGTTSPAGKLQADGDIICQSYVTGTSSYLLQVKKARGTAASPTTIVSGDTIGGILSGGYDGSAYRYTSSIEFIADGTVSASAVPAAIRLMTGTTTTYTERARVSSDGTFRVKGAGTAGSTDAVQFNGLAPATSLILDSTGSLGVGVSSPAYKLDVLGTIQARAAATQDGIQLTGRAGGTSSYAVAITPTTLTASRTLTLPDVSGTVLTTGAAVTAPQGGTGQTTYAVGDLLYASATNALSRLADVATGNALISGGVGVAPSWGKIGLTTHVSGTLAVGNGGTGLTTYTSGGVLYANSTTTLISSSSITFDSFNLIMQAGAVMNYAPTPASITTTATLTNANIQAQIITTTGSTYIITMPLGTTLESLVTSWGASNTSYDFYIINTQGSGNVTLAMNTGVTFASNSTQLTINGATSACFRIRRTATNTFTVYRLS